ncbi:MBL fold metallo-hydrolase [Massilia sp. Leaf139]|uniref:MBL fold metallo-hydrolase n=1 Tax=Massilia sp. Leaf139 TaxID=1736272 RepID=UPI0006FD8484|nr:MBL fold metallo-hydrolase [Massilia sp. Leaf139]KQQ88641.1 MBL fold metallo-hydrolase [Massilia sp. Leaf139]
MRMFERGWLSSNNVLFTGESPALVDSGYVTHAPQTLALVHHALDGRPLARLLNTHLHSDHCGGNAALQAAYGCHTAIPAAEAGKVAAWDEDALSYRATGQQCARFTFDALLRPGQALELGDLSWQVLAAPGHDPHALLLFCPGEGILIAGDALWENGFGVIFPELDGESGFEEARATLDLIATLDARLVIPGHGRMFTDVAGALERAYSRLDYLSAAPSRNAENAVKVLVKFLLLERQRVALADVPGLLASIPVVNSALRQIDIAALAGEGARVERVDGEPVHPTAGASTRRVGGPPAHASNAGTHTTPHDALYTKLATWAIASLIRARAARIDGAFLVDA